MNGGAEIVNRHIFVNNYQIVDEIIPKIQPNVAHLSIEVADGVHFKKEIKESSM